MDDLLNASDSEDEVMEHDIPDVQITLDDVVQIIRDSDRERERESNLPFEVSIYELEGFKTKAEALAAEWLESFNKGTLKIQNFREHLRLLVPKVIHTSIPEPRAGPQTLLDEKAVSKILLEPLQRFCFNNANPDDFSKLAQASNTPSSICGHVFQIGEPTYSCRDCGLDPTCVLCVSCFNASNHRTHRYKMSTSSGGGYCDCGDPEAWKQFESCKTHRTSIVTDDPGHSLPEQDAKRAHILFEFIISYAMDLLTYDYSVDPPPRYSLTEDEVTQLQVKSVAKTYACILYNDESHTFEIVIQTLTKALQISKRHAVEYATAIDRDGRAIVKSGSFKECQVVKEIIERHTSRNGMSPLKTELLHRYVVAHQSVAASLLSWVRDMVAISSGLRYVVYKVLTSEYHPEPGGLISRGNETCLEILMASDTKFWKSVRVQWHHLFISGLLKEYYMKKEFAAAFGKSYADLMKDYIYDDHDHIYSISSLSVQIFTVPTLAHFLIEKYDVFFTILRTFLSECESKLNAQNKVKFENTTTQFKRTHVVILDLKYLLTTPPTAWNEELRKQFLHGCHSFLKLLFWLQETDPVVRQSGAHVEFEPEWEAAFNTHIKLSPVITLLLEWCSTDRTVCIKMYRMVLRCIASLNYPAQMKAIVRELADHSATCYAYDISQRPVSIHLALTRLYAGLYVLLERFRLTSFDSAVVCEKQPSPEIIMEPALRVLCLCAQCHAGMWKRNGYSLMNQMYFYHNVRCRADMYDRDVIALQVGAAVIESNEFLIHVLNRLGMWNWTDENYDEQTGDDDTSGAFSVLLAEEFFQLVITLVSARFNTGTGVVTADDCVRKQVIQALCISPMQHSELNRLLVEDVYGETGIEAVIKSVTKCKRTDKGDNYELLPEYYCDYDVFHHHYTREEMSKAEGTQRERKLKANEPDFFPPPILPSFTENFMMVINILKSDVLLYMMSLVMKRSLKPTSRSLSEPQIRRVLHLIAIALNEEVARNETEPEHFFQFTEAAKRWNIFPLMGEMLKEARLIQFKDYIMWLLKRYRELRPEHCLETGLTAAEEEQRRKELGKKIAAERRLQLMASMARQQQDFRTVNEDLFEPVVEAPSPSNTAEDVEMVPEDSVALGPKQTPVSPSEEIHTCIVCSEVQEVAKCSSVFVLVGYVQTSTVHAANRKHLVDADKRDPVTLEPRSRVKYRDPLVLPSDLQQAVHFASCGHEMHLACWSKHFDNVQSRERHRPYRFRQSVNFDVEEKEFLCPLCDRLCNCVLPLTPSLLSIAQHPDLSATLTFSHWSSYFYLMLEHTMERETKQLADSNGVVGTYAKSEACFWFCNELLLDTDFRQELYVKAKEIIRSTFETFSSARIAPGLMEGIAAFQDTIYQLNPGPTIDIPSGSRTIPDPRKTSRTILGFWQTVAYTIISSEIISRDQGTPFFGNDVKPSQAATMSYLVRAAAMTRSFTDDLPASVMRSVALKLFSTLLLCGPTTDNIRHTEFVADVDAFSLLVSLTFARPYLFVRTSTPPQSPCYGRMEDYFLMKSVLYFHVAQVITQFNTCPATKGLNHKNPWYMKVFATHAEPGITPDNNFVKLFTQFVPREKDLEAINPPLWSHVYSGIMDAILPFLRCCCKFYECLTGIQARRLFSPDATHADMLEYLGLPRTAHELFDFSSDDMHKMQDMIDRWDVNILDKDKQVIFKGWNNFLKITQYPRKASKLVTLPKDYTDLINSVSAFSCIHTEACLEARTPTLCLVCGVVLCSQSYCCQKEVKGNTVGACTYHMYTCGAGVGIFLRIRDCKVFLLGGKLRVKDNSSRVGRAWDHEPILKGMYVPPPYLDQYGESDPGLRRGNPMKLDVEKYEHLRQLWLNHRILPDISRTAERANAVTTEWQYL